MPQGIHNSFDKCAGFEHIFGMLSLVSFTNWANLEASFTIDVLEVPTNAYRRRDYSYIGSLPDGAAGECVSTITAGQQISVVIYETITNSNEAASAWVTTIS